MLSLSRYSRFLRRLMLALRIVKPTVREAHSLYLTNNWST